MKGKRRSNGLKSNNKGLTDPQLQKRLDLYSRGEQNQFFKIQKIKQRYINTTRENERKRSISDTYFAQGVRTGLPHAPFEKIQHDRNVSDQRFRDEIVGEAKSEYRRYQTLSKWFNKDQHANGKSVNSHKRIKGLTAKYNVRVGSRTSRHVGLDRER